MNYLLVGDPHAMPDSLEECGKLIDFVFEQAVQHHVDRIVILGDLHHNHSLVRIEVTHFWREAFLRAPCPIIILVGNHDLGGNATGDPSVHALEAYKDLGWVTVVDAPMVIDGVGFMPYTAIAESFIASANSLGCGTLMCHATFVGAKYGNNFPAPDGVDADQLIAAKIISGHIHMVQEVGKVSYVGSPRWLTASDANQDRGIWLMDDSAAPQFMPTEGVCRKIVSFTLSPEAGEVPSFPANARVIVTLKGPKVWITETLSQTSGLAATGVEIRSVYVEDQELAVRESEGLAVSLQKFILSKEWPVVAEALWVEIQRRTQWKIPKL